MRRTVTPGLLLLSLALASGTVSCTSPDQRMRKHLSAGQAQFDKKDYSRAFLLFKNASTADPTNPEPPYRLGLTYLALGDSESALSYFRKAIELSPKHADAQIRLSQILALGGEQARAAEARQRLQGLISSAPDNADALLSLALAEGQLGNVSEAERLLLRAAQSKGGQTDALVALARLRLGRADIPAAEEVLRKAASGPSPTSDSLTALAELLFLTGRFDEAEQQLGRAIQINPSGAAALRDLAVLRHRSGRTEEAADLYRRVSGLRREYRAFHALYLAEIGRQKESISELERLYNHDHSDREIRTLLISAHFAAGSVARAEELLDAGLRANPKDIDGRLQRSVFHMRRGDYAAAERDIAEVLRLRPQSAYAHFVLSHIYATQGTLLHQRQELLEALRYDPGLLPARLQLAQALLTQGEPGQALQIIDETPEHQKRRPDTIAARNRAFIALGDLRAFSNGVSQGLSMDRTPELLLQSVLLRMHEGNHAAARLAIREALRRAPADPGLMSFLAKAPLQDAQLRQLAADVREELANRPNLAAFHYCLGQLLVRTSDLAHATEEFATAVTLSPRFLPARLALAQLELHQGQLMKARQILSAAPDGDASARIHMLRAQIEHDAGDTTASLEQYRIALGYEPNNVAVLNNLASLLAETADVEEALKYAERARELAPHNDAVADTLGWALYRKGRFREAAQHLEYAVSRAGTPVRSIHLGLAYWRSGDQSRGRALLVPAVRLHPDLPEARLAQAALQNP